MNKKGDMTEKRRRLSCLRIGLIGLLGLAGLCVMLAGVSALINLGTPNDAAVIDHLTPLEKARLAEAYHLRQTLGGLVMPGWDQADIPHIVFNEQYAFLVGCPHPGNGWKSYPRETQIAGTWEMLPGETFLGQPYYRMKLPGNDQTPQNFIVSVDDCTTASMVTYDWFRIALGQEMGAEMPGWIRVVFPYGVVTRILMTGSDQYVAAVLHEAMHAYQASVGGSRLAEAEQANFQYANSYHWEDENLIAAWQVELDLLNEAAKAEEVDEARELAARFLQSRAQRRLSLGLSPNLVDFERKREWAEGIAKYAEMLIYRAAAETPGYQPVPEILEDPEYHHNRGAVRFWNQQIDQIQQMAGAEGDGRFYYSGMAQAVLLDRLMPGWKNRLFEDGVWLEDLLDEALHP